MKLAIDWLVSELVSAANPDCADAKEARGPRDIPVPGQGLN